MARVVKVDGDMPRRRAPAITPEDREQQMIALAMDLAERQIREGTASSQTIAHFLKLASTRAQLENDKLQGENELLRAKVKAMESSENTEKLYKEALEAMRTYGGHDND